MRKQAVGCVKNLAAVPGTILLLSAVGVRCTEYCCRTSLLKVHSLFLFKDGCRCVLRFRLGLFPFALLENNERQRVPLPILSYEPCTAVEIRQLLYDTSIESTTHTLVSVGVGRPLGRGMEQEVSS